MREVLEKAIFKFGHNMQHDGAIEEMAELTKEIVKWKRYKNNEDAIAEEIADVEIMLEQLKIMHSNSFQVEEWKKTKLDRLKNK